MILLIAAALRFAVAIAYSPALLWSDSITYVFSAYGGDPVGVMIDKTSGYPAVLDLLEVPGRSLTAVTSLQHLAGLAGGVLLYALLRGRGVASVVAAAAAGVVLLDSYAMALEQHILAEAFFAFTLVLWAFVVVRWRGTPGVVLAGLLLGMAVTLRAAAAVIVPVWIVYALWAYPGVLRRVAAVAAVALPLALYASWYDSKGGGFALTQMDGYLLYGRVGQIANCRELTDVRADLRGLCPRHPVDDFKARAAFHGDYPFYYLDVARRVAGDPYFVYGGPRPDPITANRRVRSFALEVIQTRPIKFARAVADTTVDFVTPGKMSPIADFDRPILFPSTPRPIDRAHQPLVRRFIPGYDLQIRSPAGTLRSYQRWVHTPRWLMGVLILVGLAEMIALIPASIGKHLADAREVFLLVGAGLALLVGAALNHFEPRYLIPAVPLIVAGGTLAANDLVRAFRARRTAVGDATTAA